MTIPKIELIIGSRHGENIVLMCTGCHEYYEYSVRQYKGDFGCNISEFEQFLQWAKWEAAKHECFLAGRMGYLPPDFFEGVERGVKAAKEGRITPFEPDNCLTCGKPSELFVDGDCPQCNPPIEDDPLAYHVDFPQEEDPWGSAGCIEEPEEDELDAWMDEELDLPPTDYRYGALTNEEAVRLIGRQLNAKDAEQGLHESDNYDWDEVNFAFLYDSPTGRLPSGASFILKLEVIPPEPVSFDITYIEFDYADLERRVLEALAEDEGIYTRDAQGHLRDEKGRCLACLRTGVHR